MSKRIGVRSGLKGEAAPRIPALDGSPACLSSETPPQKCALCGASGHKGSDHGLSGKAVMDRAEPSTADASPHGAAVEQDRGTQDGNLSRSKQFTGSPNYESPGGEGGMS